MSGLPGPLAIQSALLCSYCGTRLHKLLGTLLLSRTNAVDEKRIGCGTRRLIRRESYNMII